MSSVDTNVFMRPTPAQVAALVASHGFEAACARWWWLDERTLGTLAQAGRAARGEALQSASKRRTYTDLDAAICVEAAHVLGSATRGERAAGIGHNTTRGLFPRRGLPFVCISPEERGLAASIGNLANGGDPKAIAERDQRHAHERAVGQVLRAALALVPEQPPFGRYRLPPVDDALRAVLAGLPQSAIEAVFPEMADAGPEDTDEVGTPATADDLRADPQDEDAHSVSPPSPIEDDPTPVLEVPAVIEIPAQRHRRVPDNSTLRRDHAGGETLVVLADRYGVTPASLYAHWRRLALSGRGRLEGFVTGCTSVAPATKATPQEPAPAAMPVDAAATEPVAPDLPAAVIEAVSPEEVEACDAPVEGEAPPDVVPALPVAERPVVVAHVPALIEVSAPVSRRLELADLALVVRLSRLVDLPPVEALALVRADAAASRHERT